MRIPRILITAFRSGGGKTTLTLGLLQALKDRGLAVSSAKCGPDYIDPAFHRAVIGARSVNLDPFFCDDHTLRYLLQNVSAGSNLCVTEGVMGYYDGLGGVSDQASTYDVARITQTPVVLVLDARGISLSLIPLLKGFVEFRRDSRIRGVILNRVSSSYYMVLKKLIEKQIPELKVYGYLPPLPEQELKSRNLGLVMPDEVEGLREKLKSLAEQMEKSVDIDGLLALAGEAEELPEEEDPCAAFLHSVKVHPETADGTCGKAGNCLTRQNRPKIAVARDEAFCFQYGENLELLEKLGADLVFFSPMRDRHLPENIDGLILYGGYPELYLPQLSKNRSMLDDVRDAVRNCLPTLAECGGFMYLFESMEDKEGHAFPMAGVFPGRAYYTGKLTRFGYISLRRNPEGSRAGIPAGSRAGIPEGSRAVIPEGLDSLCAHEFHYYDTTDNGDAFLAEKPMGGRRWTCMYLTDTMLAGFPHIYYYSNPATAEWFLDVCRRRKEAGMRQGIQPQEVSMQRTGTVMQQPEAGFQRPEGEKA